MSPGVRLSHHLMGIVRAAGIFLLDYQLFKISKQPKSDVTRLKDIDSSSAILPRKNNRNLVAWKQYLVFKISESNTVVSRPLKA